MEAVLLLLGGGTLGAAITALVNFVGSRKNTDALTKKITAEANDIVFESYREIITDLRANAEMARVEARDARHEARTAGERAADAEAVAAKANHTATRALAALEEVVQIVTEAVPDGEVVSRVEKVAARVRGQEVSK